MSDLSALITAREESHTMFVTIYGIDHLTAMADGFAPLFDAQGGAYRSAYRRLLIPREIYQLAEGIEAGTQNDPRNPGMLGGRWYSIGEEVAGPLTVPQHTHQAYTSLLRRVMWTDPETELAYAQTEPFWDICALPSNGGIMGPASVSRLAADYRATPDITEHIRRRRISPCSASAAVNFANFHRACARFIHALAQHEDGIILVQ